MDEYDSALIAVAIVGLLILAGASYYAYTLYREYRLSPFVARCEQNPVERYAQSCTTKEDCVTRCAQRLRSQEG